MPDEQRVLGNQFLWHSDLLKHEGNFIAKVTGGMRTSKKNNNFYPIIFSGDQLEYVLMSEHAGIEKALDAAPRNVWLLFTATGNREGADLVLEPADGTPVQGEISYEPVEEGLPRTFRYESVMDAYMQALASAHDLQEWFENAFEREMTEDDRKLATILVNVNMVLHNIEKSCVLFLARETIFQQIR